MRAAEYRHTEYHDLFYCGSHEFNINIKSEEELPKLIQEAKDDAKKYFVKYCPQAKLPRNELMPVCRNQGGNCINIGKFLDFVENMGDTIAPPTSNEPSIPKLTATVKPKNFRPLRQIGHPEAGTSFEKSKIK